MNTLLMTRYYEEVDDWSPAARRTLEKPDWSGWVAACCCAAA